MSWSSQEAFLHVPDTAAALAEAFRLSDRAEGWPSRMDSSPASFVEEADRCGRVGAQRSRARGLGDLIPVVGFVVLSVEDLTEEWGVILEERFAMYRQLRGRRWQGLPAGDEEFYAAYGKLVEW